MGKDLHLWVWDGQMGKRITQEGKKCLWLPLTKMSFVTELFLGHCQDTWEPPGGRIDLVLSAQCPADSPPMHGMHESASLPLLCLLSCSPAPPAMDCYCFSCVIIPLLITMSSMMTLHISVPYITYWFSCLALGGRAHFPSWHQVLQGDISLQLSSSYHLIPFLRAEPRLLAGMGVRRHGVERRLLKVPFEQSLLNRNHSRPSFS